MATAPTEAEPSVKRIWDVLINEVVPANLDLRCLKLLNGKTFTLKRNAVIAQMWEKTVSAHDP